MENSKNLKFGLTVLAYTLTAALFFAIGLFTGTRNTADVPIESENVSAYADNVEEIIYRVKIQSGKLCIYEITSSGITTIAECEISESVYPKEDVTELKSGIDFRNKSEAQAMFENFSS